MGALIVVPVINSAIGESIFAEELKGDFTLAKDLAQQALEEASRGGPPELRADALLARGVLHVLQGEPKLADAYLTMAEEARDPGRMLRVSTFRVVAAWLDRNYFPGGGGAQGPEITQGWDAFAALISAFDKRAEALEPHVGDPALHLERAAATRLINQAISARAILTQSMGGPAVAVIQETAVRPQRQFRSEHAATADPRVLAYADLVLAGLYRRAGWREAAEEALRLSREGYAACGDSAGVAACHLAAGDWRSAPFSSPLTWNLAMDSSSSVRSHLPVRVEVEEFRRPGAAELESAAASYAEAERLFALGGARRGLAAVRLRQGYLAMLADDWLTAARRAAEAQHGFDATGDKLGRWLAATHRGLASIGVDRWAENLETAKAAGAWGAGTGSFSYALGLGMLCSRVARHWLIRRGDAERALACYRYARALFEALGAPANAVQNMADRAHVLMAAGDHDGEMVTYEQAVQRCAEEAARRPDLGGLLGAWCIELTGDLWNLANREMDPDGMERASSRLTQLVAPAAGMTDPLEDHLEGHLEQATVEHGPERPGSEFQVALLMALPSLDYLAQTPALAACYRARKQRGVGNREEAEMLLRNALDAARQAPPHLRDFLEAVVHAHCRDWEAAKEAYLRAAEGEQAGTAWPSRLLEAMVRAGGQAGTAESRLQQVRRHEESALFFCRIHAYADALDHLRAIERLAGSEWWRGSERPWETLALYGEVHAGLGSHEDALGRYEQAISLIEERRALFASGELRTTFVGEEGVQHVYGDAVRAAFALYEAADDATAEAAARAWGYAERGKARALLDSMSMTTLLAGGVASESEPLRRWRECSAQFTALRAQMAALIRRPNLDADGPLAELRAQVDQAEQALRAAELELAGGRSGPLDLLTSSVMPSIREIGGMLSPATALLEYAFLGEDAIAWSITNEGLMEAVRLPVDTDELPWRIDNLHDACATGKPWDTAATWLADAVLAPLAKTLRTNGRLVIVPHGAAHRLPFHALPWDGEPLVARRTVSYLPSAASLRVLAAATRSVAELPALIVGDPALMAYREPLRQELVAAPPLPAAATEAAYVASLVGGELLLHEQADERSVRERISDARLLHFATHGHLSQEAPLLSEVLLANGESLTVYELLGLRLEAELVVLSACETGLGQATGGDDVLGLSRGLLAAGARAAVVSLWPVDDVSTALLMGELYRRMLDGDSPAAALRHAQRYLRRLDGKGAQAETERLRVALAERHAPASAMAPVDQALARDLRTAEGDVPPYSHPYHWAPFVLIGAV